MGTYLQRDSALPRASYRILVPIHNRLQVYVSDPTSQGKLSPECMGSRMEYSMHLEIQYEDIKGRIGLTLSEAKT